MVQGFKATDQIDVRSTNIPPVGPQARILIIKRSFISCLNCESLLLWPIFVLFGIPLVFLFSTSARTELNSSKSHNTSRNKYLQNSDHLEK